MADDDFLSRFPANMTGLEKRLRSLLLEVAEVAEMVIPKTAGGSLGRWVEHRMPDEIAFGLDELSLVTLELLGAPDAGAVPNGRPAASPADDAGAEKKPKAEKRHEKREEFFASLPEDQFTEQEEAARVALYEFMNGWTKEAHPTLQDAHSYPPLQRAKKELCGKDISFKGWLEARMGGEIMLSEIGNGNAQIGLTELGYDVLDDLRDQMQEQQMGGIPAAGGPRLGGGRARKRGSGAQRRKRMRGEGGGMPNGGGDRRDGPEAKMARRAYAPPPSRKS
eukprot:TRINITY_DN91028_c0_g1_i1.p1 TRINITY_DN91028_c0_g1~~TRINITY_DN91028_c0_g1_i1.p1  ORF type:complete len:279 (+),score=87.02 TRINITY_DN91028_c0_g1_i1:96-932(+)